MFTKEVTYTNFNGEEVTEKLSFHLSIPEVIKLEARIGMELQEYVQKVIANEDMTTMIEFIEEVMLTAYGTRTTDGRSFMKGKAQRDEFEYSLAYAQLFQELLTVPGLAQEFGEQVAEKAQSKRNVVAPKVVE